MKHRSIIIPAAIAVILLLGAGCVKQILRDGDTIVSPVKRTQSGEASGEDTGEGPINSGILNSMSNISPFAQPSTDTVYSMLDKTCIPLSIFADNKYLYLLRCTEDVDTGGNADDGIMARHGDVVDIYDVENGSLARRLSSQYMGKCSTFTVKESNVYTFDVATGRISLFSSGGSFLASYDTRLEGVYAEKLVIADNRLIVIKIRENAGDKSKIAVFDPDTGLINSYTAGQLLESLPGENSKREEAQEITDFCLYDEDSILISFSQGMLSLFDIKRAEPEKSCVFPISAGFMEYEGNVLYYAADAPLFLNPGNTANFTNIKAGRQIGRMLINSGFTWPKTEQELGEWLLNGLQINIADENRRHYAMARNTKYLFFLDFVPAVQGSSEPSKPGYTVYRIAK